MDHSDKGLELKITSFEYHDSGTFTYINSVDKTSWKVFPIQEVVFSTCSSTNLKYHRQRLIKNKTFVLTLQLKNIRQIINHNDKLK